MTGLTRRGPKVLHNMTYEEFHKMLFAIDASLKASDYLKGKKVTIEDPQTGRIVEVDITDVSDYRVNFDPKGGKN